MKKTLVDFIHISKGFGEQLVLDDLNLSVHENEFLTLLGPSGCGKTTTLRILGGFESPDKGQVIFDGQDITHLPPNKRNLNTVFQKYALFSHMSVSENIAFGLKISGKSDAYIKDKIRYALKLVNLEGYENRLPDSLSGGQQQRIAIARALATDPKILLCDEATSALDPNTTHSVLSLIKDINRKLGITVIIITHQMSVVEEVCNKVAILDHGEVVEKGAVSDVFTKPKSAAARKLVFPDGVTETLPLNEGEHHIRIVFNGANATNTPLIAKLAIEKNIEANILSANTKTIEGKSYGNMLLGISGSQDTVKEAISYLSEVGDVIIEEVDQDVR